MNHLIIGMGEVGKAVYDLFRFSNHKVLIRDKKPILTNPESVDVMHICFPFSDDFEKQVRDYIDMYSPVHVIIYSTVQITTTKNISPKAVHSPVEGKHPNLADSMRIHERWIGYNDKDEAFFFVNLFSELGLRTRKIENSDFTEALKLFSTAEYGINIVFADFKAKIAEIMGMDYELMKDWNIEYNKLYKNLGMEKRVQKFVLDAPDGKIGGHCVVSNAKILNKIFIHPMLQQIIDMEEKK